MYPMVGPVPFSEKRKNVIIGEWFGMGLLSRIRKTVQILWVRSSYSISQFCYKLHWPEHILYIIEIFRREVHET